MLTILSPAKSLDFESPLPTKKSSEPRMADQADMLATVMATKRPDEIGQLLGISTDLAELNYQRFQAWDAAGPNGAALPAKLLKRYRRIP